MKHNFTLVELLVTVGIIAILAGLVIPAVISSQNQGRITQAKSDMNAIKLALKSVETTYGKGIMQTTYLLVTGGAFKLTTARILWPDRTTCIHEKGIIVDGLNATEIGESALIRASQILKSA